ncbi:MAG: GxxExxY protein [Phycisphaerae bacterium]|nr:GxxExxY protein [Saprospiraceae bacterium]
MTKKEVNQIAYDIISCAIEVHKILGPGLLESVYEACLEYELKLRGFDVQRQRKVIVTYKEITLETELRFDLLVNDCVIVELKAVQEINSIEIAKLLSYMKLLKKPKGLMINFFTDKITKSTTPYVNEYFSALPDGD